MIASRLLPPGLLGQPPQLQHPAIGKLGPVGRCPSQPSLVIAIGDDSGSITAPGGADPVSNRYVEMRLALEAIAKRCRCKQELAAVLHFDSPAGEGGPVLLGRKSLEQLEPSLGVPMGGWGTSDLLPALTRATELANAHPEHKAVVVIFSDFMLTDDDPGAVARAVIDFPGVVHAVVLGGGTAAPLAVDHETVIEHGSEPGAVARALLAGLTHNRQ